MKLFFQLGVTAAGFATLLIVVYIWALPIFFHGYKTYSVFIFGNICAGLLSYRYVYRAFESMDSIVLKIVISSVGGLVVAGLVAFASLFVILNVRGS